MYRKRLSPEIHWYEGMLLEPHHLQQLTRAGQDALTYHTRRLSPYQWGICELRISEEALVGGRLVVEEIDAILEDGVVAQTPLIAGPLERDLAPFDDRLREGERLTVSLAVPTPGPRMVESGEGDDPGYPLRYRSEAGAEVLDETTGAGAIGVSRLRLNARLLVGDEDPTGYRTLPLVEIEHRQDALRLTDYVPPTVLVTSESPLGDLVRKLCLSIRSRATEIAGSFDAAVRHDEAGKTLLARFQGFGLIASLLPMEQMVDLECFRPVDIYMALCRVLGELSTLRPDDIIPPSAPTYDHRDLRGTFGGLDERIRGLLRPLESNYESLEVRGSDGTFEVLGLRPEHLDRDMLFAVRAGPRADSAALARWVETNCIIATGDQVRSLMQFKILGIERKLEEPAPIDFPHRRGDLVYRLLLSPEYLQALRESGSLFLVRAQKASSETTTPRTLEFYVRKGR